MTRDEPANVKPELVSARVIPVGPLLFCVALALAGAILVGIAVWRVVNPAERDGATTARDIADEARQLVRQNKPAPLSEPLTKILADAENVHFDSYQHPLVGKPAPEFTAPDVDGKSWSLREALKQGPVVVVFYLGYYCNHCVSQLFDINEDYKYFGELGARVVALSPDTAVETKAKYKEYGSFSFPVLSDSSKAIAQSYGVFTPAKNGEPPNLEHGTFVIDRKGIVRWAAFGPAPFGHNPTLLYELDRIRKGGGGTPMP